MKSYAPRLTQLTAVVLSLSLSFSSIPFASAAGGARVLPIGARILTPVRPAPMSLPRGAAPAPVGLARTQIDRRQEAPITAKVRALAEEMNLDPSRPATAAEAHKLMNLAERLERRNSNTAHDVRRFAQMVIADQAGRAAALDAIYTGGKPASEAPAAALTGEREARQALGLKKSAGGVPAAYDVPLEKLRWSPDVESLPASTAEHPAPSGKVFARDRELKQMRAALQMDGKGYNLFLAGVKGSGRKTALRALLDELAPKMPTPGDLVTVTNPVDPSEPIQLDLPAGAGESFQAGLRELMIELSLELPKQLRSGPFAAQAKAMRAEVNQALNDLKSAAYDDIRAMKVGEKFGVEIDDSPVDERGVAVLNPVLTFEGRPIEDPQELIQQKRFTKEEWEKARREYESKAMPAFFSRLERLGEQQAEARAQAELQIKQAEALAAQNIISAKGRRLVQIAEVPVLTDAPGFKEWYERKAAEHRALEAELEEKKLEQGDVSLRFAFMSGERVATIPMYRGKPFESEEQFRAVSAETKAALEAMKPAAMAVAEAFETKHRDFHETRDREEAEFRRAYENGLTPAQKKVLQTINMLVSRWASDHEMFMHGPQTHMHSSEAGPELHVSPAERFRADVLRANKAGSGAPVVYEMHPTVASLTGKMEDEPMEAGGRRIMPPGGPKMKGGALLKAHGGYLVVDAYNALTTPGVWDVLMKAVDRGEIEIGSGSPLAALYSQGYKVENNRVKLILTGSQFIKDILRDDPQFDKNFRGGIVEFDERMDYDGPGGVVHASYLDFFKKAVVESAGQILDVTRDGLQAAFEYLAEVGGSHSRLSIVFGDAFRLLKEATQLAKETGKAQVDREVWQAAVRNAAERESIYKRQQHRYLASDQNEIRTTGSKVGQINGLVVYGEGGYGGPSAITASVSYNPEGGFEIVSTDRLARLAGSSMIKSLETVQAYIMNRFGPMNLRVSVQFEQAYGGIDGDSATLAMLTVVLSAIAQAPVYQNRAITGSMGQLGGNAQVIGGPNEKSDVLVIAKARGHATKEDPFVMVLPHKNVRNLALSDEKLQMVKDGAAKLRAVHNEDQAIEEMTGLDRAEVDRRVRSGYKAIVKAAKSAASREKSKTKKK